MKLAHTMIRVKDLQATLDFYTGFLGLREVRRHPIGDEATLVFLADEDESYHIELTYNHDGRDYELGDQFGHLAFHVEDLDSVIADVERRGWWYRRSKPETKSKYIFVTRIPEEMTVYRTVCRIAHRIIAEGLSVAVIQPGVTTTDDVEWWYRERIAALSLATWFHPDVSLQRAEAEEHSGSFASRVSSETILPGDLLHVDFGITYLGLHTDTQQHAYVLRPGESEAPEGLRRGLAAGNRMQDVLTGEFRTGRTGNEILAAALQKGRAEGLRPTIYTHPLGLHGHGAGPTIGLWDEQDGVPGAGDYPLSPETAYSIELNVAVDVPEWGGRTVRVMLEEDAFFDGRSVTYLDGRQTHLLLIPREP